MKNVDDNLSAVEIIKDNSNYLRGTIVDGLYDRITGAISDDDTQLIKFHGLYQQQDRDLESERRKQKLEPYYMFMIRVRVPGGIASPSQWLNMDRIADTFANKTIKLTTRQAFQFHGVLKRNIKPLMKSINGVLMDTIAACGDVNRNVMCSPDIFQSDIHNDAYLDAKKISLHLTPNTTAYHEIWLDRKLVEGGEKVNDKEPVYGKTYLPRKFKIAIAIPPRNDTDVFTNDLSFIAIVNNGVLTGYNVVVGGGMGSTFGNTETYPRLGDVIGYCQRDKVVDIAEKVVLVQRNNGNRKNRKNARLKYTIENMGLDRFKTELYSKLGYELEAPKYYKFTSNGDYYGWKKGTNGKWSFSLFVEGGRVKDTEKYKLKTGLKEIALFHDGDLRLTGNQNLIIANISEVSKPKIVSILSKYNIINGINTSALRLNSIACVAMNTCGLANAESERYLPSLITKIEKVINEYGLQNEAITIRMTGCPNGCARPYVAEMAFIGKGPGQYNMYLGGGFYGQRLNRLYKESLTEPEILNEVSVLLKLFAEERKEEEKFGDFVIRKGIIREIKQGKEFSH